MKLLKFFIGFVIVSVFTLFGTANMENVQVNFLFKNQPLLGYSKTMTENADNNETVVKEPRQIPLFLLIFTTFGFGFIVSWVLSSSLVRSYKHELKKLKKQFDNLVRERDELRNLSVNNDTDNQTSNDTLADNKICAPDPLTFTTPGSNPCC